ncbi:hypothetical protein ACFE04_017366 [Oxalis oulophora]
MDLKMIEGSEITVSNKKSCIDCHTTTTPLWRGGPGGPRSLCNACGIRRNRKRRMGILRLDKEGKTKRRKINNHLELVKSEFLLLREEEQAAVLLMSLSCASA